jgi:hypothetical protein
MLFLSNSVGRSVIMKESQYLREQARECATAAQQTKDQASRRSLLQLAGYYEKEANKLDAGTLKVMH